MIHSRRQNILSIYNGPWGLLSGKGRKTVSQAGARAWGFGQPSSPDGHHSDRKISFILAQMQDDTRGNGTPRFDPVYENGGANIEKSLAVAQKRMVSETRLVST